MPKKNTTTYILMAISLVGVVLLLIVAYVFSLDKPVPTTQAFKIKASSTTYKKVVNLKMISPTIALPVISITPTSTDFNIVVTQSPTIIASSTPTISFTYQTTPAPSSASTQELPQSGLFGISMGAILLGFTTILVAFLF